MSESAEKGADLESKDHYGQTPLSVARYWYVKKLLEKASRNLNK